MLRNTEKKIQTEVKANMQIHKEKIRRNDADLVTISVLQQKMSISRARALQLAREADAAYKMGRTYLIDAPKTIEYFKREYKAD